MSTEVNRQDGSGGERAAAGPSLVGTGGDASEDGMPSSHNFQASNMKRIIILSLTGFFLAAVVWVFFVRHSGAKEPLPGISSDSSGSSRGEDTLPLDARRVADEYVKSLDGTSWSRELGQWIAEREYRAAVDSSREADATQWEFEKYCFKTSTQEDGCTREYSFYDNGDWSKPEALLQQVVIIDHRVNQNKEMAQKIWEMISDSLTKRFGPPGNVPEDNVLSPFHLGALREKKPLFWQDGVKRVILAEHFRWKGDVRTDFIMLLSRSRALDSSAHRSQELEESYENAGIPHKALIAELCDSVRPARSPLSVLCRPGGPHNGRLDDLVRCGKFVADAGRTGDSVHLPLYRMALYLLGESYSPKDTAEASTLRQYGIAYEYSELAASWEYSAMPLVDLYTRYPGTRWGQLAFVMLQNTGWCLEGMCNGNNGPEVISKGEEFLGRFPGSVFAAAVVLTIGKGYETNWNVSTCDSTSEYMYDPGHRFDEDSRLKAIATYEKLIASYPTSREAAIAKLRLPRLKLGVSTGRADYFYIYD